MNTTDSSRRNFGLALLGVLGGAAFLEGCNQSGSETSEASLSEVRDAVTGTTFVWFDKMFPSQSGQTLKGTAGPSNANRVAVVAGYGASADGGGGIFWWDYQSTATDDGGTIIQATGVTNGRWKRLYSGPINVKWFGAKGDGITADDGAIQRAIKAATGFDASVPGSTATRTGTIFMPIGNYAISNKLLFVGNEAHTLRLEGELGSDFGTSTVLSWTGASSGFNTMLELRAWSRGLVEGVTFNGNSVASGCVWVRSNQAAAGAGTSGSTFRRCTFSNVSSGSQADPTLGVLCLVGEQGSYSYQVDTLTWEDCYFSASSPSAISAAACWRCMQNGNTSQFAFYRCDFAYAQYGIDWQIAANCLLVDGCTFATVGVPSWAGGQADAACIRAGNGIAVIRSCMVQAFPATGGCRFLTSAGVSNVAGATVTIEGCQVYCTMPDDNCIVTYPGQLLLIGNVFTAGYPGDPRVPRIACGPTDLSTGASTLYSGYGSIVSINNMYPYLTQGDYAPLYESSVQLTGPSSAARGTKRTVWSLGDNTLVVSGQVLSAQLQPWFGVTPNVGATVTLAWTPPTSIPNASVATASVGVSFTVNPGDFVAVSYNQPLPPGVLLTAALTGSTTVTATLLNMSGATLTNLAAGNLTFTVQPRT